MSEPTPQTPSAPIPAPEPAIRPHWLLRSPATALAALALGVALVQWYGARGDMGELRAELARRLAEAESLGKESRAVVREGADAIRGAEAKVALFEAKLADSQNQYIALEALYRELAGTRDNAIVAQVDQLVTTAAEQLQLTGNVRGALVALEAAEAHVAGAEKPQFLQLRKALNRDIELLRTTPQLDTAGLSLKLDLLAQQIDQLPLAAEERAKPGAPERDPGAGAQASWLNRYFSSFWSELKPLVRVSKLDASQPMLFTPGQAFFLRENVKLRLMNARLALLQREQAVFRNDLDLVRRWLTRFFDPKDPQTVGALAKLAEFEGAKLRQEVPTLAESLNAVHSYRVSRRGPAR